MRKFRNISAIALALVMLLTVAGQAMTLHFCGGEFQKINFAGEATSCHQDETLPPCHQPKEQKSKKHEQAHRGCCENQAVISQTADLKNISLSKVNLQKTFVFVAVVLPEYFNFIFQRQEDFTEKPHGIPRMERDIPVLFQTFLI